MGGGILRASKGPPVPLCLGGPSLSLAQAGVGTSEFLLVFLDGRLQVPVVSGAGNDSTGSRALLHSRPTLPRPTLECLGCHPKREPSVSIKAFVTKRNRLPPPADTTTVETNTPGFLRTSNSGLVPSVLKKTYSEIFLWVSHLLNAQTRT